MNALVMKNIKKSFSNKTIIPDLNFEVKKGAFVALLGPSGCGKTTLLRMVAGLDHPTEGEIMIADHLVYSETKYLPPEERGLGMVFQSYAVWPHMSVYENVAYPLHLRKNLSDEDKKTSVLKALELVHLENYQTRYPHQLSGGQQQRVALARGLVMQPPILLLDEPLSNLDAKLRAEMRREIRDLHRKLGITILYVTHDQKEAFEMSTEVLVMNEGKIEQRGTPEEIKNHPQAGFVKEFLSEF